MIMKKTSALFFAFCVLVSGVFGGGRRDAHENIDEVMLVSQGMDIEYANIDAVSPMGMLLMFADELELTDEQRERIIDIEVKYGESLNALMLQIRQISLDIDKKLHEEAPLEDIKPMLQKKAELYAEEEWLELVQWDAEIKVLSDEQRKKWKVMERDYMFHRYDGETHQ